MPRRFWSRSDCVAIDEVNPVWLKTPAAPMEKVTIDIEQVPSAFRTLQDRVEYVVVEGTGGWLVPIRSNYFGNGNEAAGSCGRTKPAGLS